MMMSRFRLYNNNNNNNILLIPSLLASRSSRGSTSFLTIVIIRTTLVVWLVQVHLRSTHAFAFTTVAPQQRQRQQERRHPSRSFLLHITYSSSGGGGGDVVFKKNDNKNYKGKLLILGGTGFLGQAICKRAALEGYAVTSLSRRGLPSTTTASFDDGDGGYPIDYRQGDARKREAIDNILNEDDGEGEPYVGVIHCIGLLLDQDSGLGQYNRFASGSGSVPDAGSTYDSIVRLTAFNAIDAVSEYGKKNETETEPFPFCFVSAAEVGWPNVPGGTFIESIAPDFLKRYLEAKRAVESKLLLQSSSSLRPIIVRPSLIYSMDRPASYLPVGAFFVGNKIGLPFVDRPVSVQSLATAIVRAMGRPDVQGVLRYLDIDKLNEEG